MCGMYFYTVKPGTEHSVARRLSKRFDVLLDFYVWPVSNVMPQPKSGVPDAVRGLGLSSLPERGTFDAETYAKSGSCSRM